MLLLSPSLMTLEGQDADQPRGAPCWEETTAKQQGLTVGTQGCFSSERALLSLPNKVWETYCFCSVSYYYYITPTAVG